MWENTNCVSYQGCEIIMKMGANPSYNEKEDVLVQIWVESVKMIQKTQWVCRVFEQNNILKTLMCSKLRQVFKRALHKYVCFDSLFSCETSVQWWIQEFLSDNNNFTSSSCQVRGQSSYLLTSDPYFQSACFAIRMVAQQVGFSGVILSVYLINTGLGDCREQSKSKQWSCSVACFGVTVVCMVV